MIMAYWKEGATGLKQRVEVCRNLILITLGIEDQEK